ncbi:isochorismatase family protein [Saccharothrix luteola]|uniref:isochorismatase family protein n=1 Tax=Saccharothrix luteola TaxID=2893018 RepID=UPI0027E2ACB8|nr:isochorismatase family protein [Saccharothrix luteola]
MIVSSIPEYPMPGREDLPPNVAPWRLDPGRAVLLIHDMQQYFVDFFPAGAAPREDLIRNSASVKAAAVALGIPVVYTAQPGSMSEAQRGLLRDFWGPGMDRRPEHRRVVAPLEPGPDDVVVTKWRYSAFVGNDLDDVIRSRGRDQVVICGIYAHIGCLITACDAFSRDLEAFLVADAVADFTPEEHMMALDYAARRCAVVLPTESVLARLAEAVDARGEGR